MARLHPTLFPLLLISLVSQAYAAPIISEFMASNGQTLADEDGEYSDWIEIHNPDNTAVDLTGWHLTDDASLLGKWTLPAVTLEPDQYLIVFASGKNRTNANNELHTNFSLTKDGEYLALVEPGGVTKSTEFSPAYPPQKTDLSYGQSSPTTDLVLINSFAPATALIPTESFDTNFGTSWRNAGFDDAAWSSGNTGVGYDNGTDYDEEIGLDTGDVNKSVYVRVPISTAIDPSTIVSLKLRMKYDDGFAAFLNGSPITSVNAPAALEWDSAASGGNEAEVFEEFDITEHLSALTNGSNNLLAIQGLNATTTSSDLIILPELHARINDPNIPASVGFFNTPTPAAINESIGYQGLLTDTGFTVGRGFYTSIFTETVHCPDLGATLIYTTDGSVPSLINGTQVAAADANSAPSFNLTITTTTVLRVIAVKDGHLSTNVDSQSYIFPSHVMDQTAGPYPTSDSGRGIWDFDMDEDALPDGHDLADDLLAIPTLSITIDSEDFWGSNGIYKNPTSTGSNWERACSAEWLLPDGSKGFQEDAGIKIQGSGSRTRAEGKRSLRIVFRDQYGSGKLNYPLFGKEGAEKIDNIVLRGAYFDSWTVHDTGNASNEGIHRVNSMLLRDEFGRQTHDAMTEGDPVVQGRWAHVYFNGKYWGLYNLHERPDQHFAEDRFGGSDDDYDVIKTRKELVSGDFTAWDALFSKLAEDTTDPDVYDQIREMIDVESFADYLICNFWGANNDWPHNNWYIMRHRPSNGKFYFVVWDIEHYLFKSGDTGPMNEYDANTPGYVWSRLRRNEEFAMYFADRVHKHCANGGALTPTENLARFNAIIDTVHGPMHGEAARWGDTRQSTPHTVEDDFDVVVADKRDNYIPGRTNTFLSKLRSNDHYPDTEAPTFSQFGGAITSGFLLSISNPNAAGTLYVTTDGSDPREVGGTVSSSAQTITSTSLTSSSTIKARVLDSGEWSPLTEADFIIATTASAGSLAVSEIHFNPADPSNSEIAAGYTDADDFEFIELMNTSNNIIDLTNVSFTAGITFTFNSSSVPTPSDRELAPGQRIILAANIDAFNHRYENAATPRGSYTGSLNNGGEGITIQLGSTTLLSFNYSDDHPWPEPSDGDGYSLVLIDPLSNPNHSAPLNWRASVFEGGSPVDTDSSNFAGLASFDSNKDGVPDLLHYALSSNPVFTLDDKPGIKMVTTSMDGPAGMDDYNLISFTRNLAADDTLLTLEHSADLDTWQTDNIEFLSTTHNGDGTATYTYRYSIPVGTKHFFRLDAALKE